MIQLGLLQIKYNQNSKSNGQGNTDVRRPIKMTIQRPKRSNENELSQQRDTQVEKQDKATIRAY